MWAYFVTLRVRPLRAGCVAHTVRRYRRVIARPVHKLAVAIRVPRPILHFASCIFHYVSERGAAWRTLCAATGGARRADCPRYRRVIARPVRKLAVAIRIPRPLMPDA